MFFDLLIAAKDKNNIPRHMSSLALFYQVPKAHECSQLACPSQTQCMREVAPTIELCDVHA